MIKAKTVLKMCFIFSFFVFYTFRNWKRIFVLFCINFQIEHAFLPFFFKNRPWKKGRGCNFQYLVFAFFLAYPSAGLWVEIRLTCTPVIRVRPVFQSYFLVHFGNFLNLKIFCNILGALICTWKYQKIPENFTKSQKIEKWTSYFENMQIKLKKNSKLAKKMTFKNLVFSNTPSNNICGNSVLSRRFGEYCHNRIIKG